MLKKLGYGIAFFWALWVSVSVIAVTKAKSASGPAWTDHPNAQKIQQPTVETKHELISEDHTADVVAIEQVWGLYSFYTDTDNGPGMASIFTPDGVFQHLYNDGHGKFLPTFGIVAPGDSGKTPTGQPIGSGCVLKGRDEIAQYKRMGRVNPLPWPGHSHHETPSILVKVSDDGQTAVLTTPSIQPNTDDKGAGRLNTNGYRAFFKKTSEGWEMAELYDVLDYPSITPKCDTSGNLPREFTPAVPQP